MPDPTTNLARKEGRPMNATNGKSLIATARAHGKPKAEAPPTTSRPPNEACGHEEILCPCGHVEQMPLFADDQDRYRDDRRRKIASRDCGQCRKAASQAAAAAKVPRGPRAERLDRALADRRLPNGAAFYVVYDAATESWSGCLGVNNTTVSGSASGVFGLLQLLDRRYRAACAGHYAEPPAKGGGA
jgi:hypothetical protein